jgi:hypothetical protein
MIVCAASRLSLTARGRFETTVTILRLGFPAFFGGGTFGSGTASLTVTVSGPGSIA